MVLKRSSLRLSTGVWDTWQFYIGAVIKLAACILLAPSVQTEWFVPFVRDGLATLSLDPWTQHMDRGGDPLAFPYGPAMYLVHAPAVGAGMLADAVAGTSVFVQIAFAASLFAADFGVYMLLRRLFPSHRAVVTSVYWLSPLVFYITYWHGQTDVIPVFFLVAAASALGRSQAGRAGVFLALAIGAKASMVLAAPFFAAAVLFGRQFYGARWQFVTALAIGAAALALHLATSPGLQAMLFGSPEASRVLDLSLPVGEERLYLWIVAYIALLAVAFSFRRLSFELSLGLLAAGLFSILLFAPASIGWYLWIAPFFPMLVASAERRWIGVALALLFQSAVIALNITKASGPLAPWLGLDARAPWELHWLAPETIAVLQSALLSLTFALGLIVVALLIWRGLVRNAALAFARRPITIGIAGDSGVGKDTLSRALVGLFGDKNVAYVSGDDYHLFERGEPLWSRRTHLDPLANDLDQFTRDVLALMNGRSITGRHYDHSSGRFTPTRTLRARDVVLAAGLHALYPDVLRRRFDVAIFVDMDEGLRRYFKVRRDVRERGHALEKVLKSIESRAADGQNYVRPQEAHAVLTFALQPVDPDGSIDMDAEEPAMRLMVRWRNALMHEDVARVLVGLCGASAEITSITADGDVEMIVDAADVEPADFELAAQQLAAGRDFFIPRTAQWSGGLLGVMQLMTVVELSRGLHYSPVPGIRL